MDTIKITKVSLLNDGRLAIYPATAIPMFEYIYREASGVYWSKEFGCFLSAPPQDLDYLKWYGQIVSVVWSGLRVKLDLTPDTQFEGAPENFKADIIKANTDAQIWIHEHENR